MKGEILSAADIARELKCSRSEAYRRIVQIPFHYRVGRMVRVRREHFERWLEEHELHMLLLRGRR